MQDSARYTYRPLDKQRMEIRLLVVLPALQSPTLPVACTIQHTFLSEKPVVEYETISYLWGDPTPRCQIAVDGCRLDVPQSAEDVLRRMRYEDRPRALWIDAVCINQTDIDERSEQVAIMAEIYSRCICCLVWLGCGSRPRAAATAVTAVLQNAREQSDDFRNFLEGTHDVTGALLYSSTGISAQFDSEPLLELFASSWFQRLWVR